MGEGASWVARARDQLRHTVPPFVRTVLQWVHQCNTTGSRLNRSGGPKSQLIKVLVAKAHFLGSLGVGEVGLEAPPPPPPPRKRKEKKEEEKKKKKKKTRRKIKKEKKERNPKHLGEKMTSSQSW